MAGIGFQLKKLFRHQGFMMNARAYAFSAFVTVGPMLLCMVMVMAIQSLLKIYGAPLSERELFVAVAQYGFVFSQLVTSGFIMIMYRFIADMIYLKQLEYILPSLHGIMAVILLIGGTSGAIFYLRSPLDWNVKITAYLLFIELLIIWIQMVYISALKDYMRIVKSFCYGVALSLGCSYVLVEFFHIVKVYAVIGSIDLGFFVMILLFTHHIEVFFRDNNRKYFHFFSYFDKYPALFFIGFFYTLGLYVHNFIYWGSHFQVIIKNTFALAPFYDVPVFYALMSIIPSMVIFVVSVETEFYETYKNYYSTILNGGTIRDIQLAKKEMYNALMQQIGRVVEVQLFFSVFSLMLGILFFSKLGLTKLQLETFFLLVFGAYFCITMYIMTLVLLYFDDRKGVLGIMAVFLLTNTLFTYLFVQTDSHGFSFFLSALLALIISFVRVYYLLKNIDYYTFCSQPILFKEEKIGTWGNIMKELERWDQTSRKK